VCTRVVYAVSVTGSIRADSHLICTRLGARGGGPKPPLCSPSPILVHGQKRFFFDSYSSRVELTPPLLLNHIQVTTRYASNDAIRVSIDSIHVQL
jgi:hypothetical protein